MNIEKEIKLTPRKFEALSSLEYSMFTCPFPDWPNMESLVIEFRGECGYGCRSNSDAIFMTAMIKAGLVAWASDALVLDLREMKYEWGDRMSEPLCAAESHSPDRLVLRSIFGEASLVEEDMSKIPAESLIFPSACVVSDRNRVGLNSLVKQEMGLNPEEFLFETLGDALAAVDRQAQRLFKKTKLGLSAS